jgi:two-component system, OmpR family, sensor kinase
MPIEQREHQGDSMEGARQLRGDGEVLALPGFQDELLELLAHELRAPLNAVRWLAEVVWSSAEDLSPEEIRRAMESLLRSQAFMDSLLDSMMAEADAASAEVRLRRRMIKVDDLARETVVDLAGILRDRLVAVSVGGQALAVADPDRLRQALTALLVNASKHSVDGTPISVRVIGRPGVVEVAVADHCDGIPPGARERIFDRYSRLDHTGGGRGLGLFLARRIARAHGGDLRVSSSPSWGCRFVIVLPRSAFGRSA